MNKKKTHILLVNYAFSMFRGGGENFDLNISKELKKKNIDCSILCVKPILGEIRIKGPNNLDIIYVNGFWFYDFSVYLKTLDTRLSKLSYFIRLIGQISFEISAIISIWKRKDRYSLIVTSYMPLVTLVSSNLLRIKSIIRCSGPFRSPYEKLLFRFLKIIICNGDTYRKLIKIYPEKIKYVEIGVDHSFTSLNTIKHEKEYIDIAIVGRLVPVKGIGELIDVLKLVSMKTPIKIHIFGDGVLMHQLKQQVNKLKINRFTTFYGYCDKKQLIEQLKRMDCLIMNSVYDNFPNSIIEANALGLPVWSPNVGGVDLLIRNHQNGLIVDKSLNRKEKAKSIVELIRLIKSGSFNSSLISSQCKKYFNWENTMKKLLAL